MEFDVTDLQPGDTVSVEECQKITELHVNHREYPLRLVMLAKMIEDSLWRIGRQLTVRCQHNTVCVLTHAEAIEYNQSTFDSGRKKMRLAHKRALAVDVSALSESLRGEHFENLTKQGAMLSAMRQRPKLDVEAFVSNMPKRG